MELPHIRVNRTTMEETLDVEAKSHIEMFHHYFFTLAPDDKYIRYSTVSYTHPDVYKRQRINTSDPNCYPNSTQREQILANSENHAGWSRSRVQQLNAQSDGFTYTMNYCCLLYTSRCV